MCDEDLVPMPPVPELYEVLRPVYLRTGIPTPWSTPQTPSHFHRVHWLVSGVARDMVEAKEKFGGSPVLRPFYR